MGLDLNESKELTSEEERPLASKRQPRVWSASNFIFLALADESRWSVLSLAADSSHQQCMVGEFIRAELATGGASEAVVLVLKQNSDVVEISTPDLLISSLARWPLPN